MPYGLRQKFVVIAVISNLLTPANVQIAMPMYMPVAAPQPVYGVPAPVAIAVAIKMPDQKTTSTTTTTTTESPKFAIAMPVPVPMGVQFAIPAQPPPVFCQNRPSSKACPPCPPCVCMPSCTPPYFSYCSLCHQKCRCRNPEETPVASPQNPPIPIPGLAYPVPMPMVPAPVGPPPVVVVPLPPIIHQPSDISSTNSDESDVSCDSSRDSHYFRSGKILKRNIKKRKRKYRRTAMDETEQSAADLVKPVLSYVSENGDVKFRSKLSNNDALKILTKGNIRTFNEQQTANIETEDDSTVVRNGRRKLGRKGKNIALRDSPTNRILTKGKNKFILKPPPNKKIKSVGISVHVT